MPTKGIGIVATFATTFLLVLTQVGATDRSDERSVRSDSEDVTITANDTSDDSITFDEETSPHQFTDAPMLTDSSLFSRISPKRNTGPVSKQKDILTTSYNSETNDGVSMPDSSEPQTNSCCPSNSMGLVRRFWSLPNCFGSPPVADSFPLYSAYIFGGVDSFRGITNGTYPSNNGFVGGANIGGALPLLSEYGFGGQFGMSYAGYNFSGTTSPGSSTKDPTQQTFMTVGLYRRAFEDGRVSFGLVHDWMFSDNFGTFGNSPMLSQFRGQIAYAADNSNQFGFWSTFNDFTTTKSTGAFGTPISYRTIDQGNIFWDHHYGESGAVGRFYIGVPLQKRLDQSFNGFPVGGNSGTLGSFILGTNWTIPVSRHVSVYTNGMYMPPSSSSGLSSSGAIAQSQEFWNVSVGLIIAPASTNRSRSITGRSWLPYLPVANNGNFLVDTTKTE